MFFKKSKVALQFQDISSILEDRAKSESYIKTLLGLAQRSNWGKKTYEQNYENLVTLCEHIQKENEILTKLISVLPISETNQNHHSVLPTLETNSIKNLNQVLGIDLGTSKSTVGVYKINSRGRAEIDIISNKQGERSNPSVVCLYNGKVYFGKEAIKCSIKCPQNLIYDTKRMLGRKFDDPFIQKMRKYWTFKTLKSDNGGILIEVDGYRYEPYEISGMILNYLVLMANERLKEPTNYAIITIPAYFTERQKEETRKAAKSANLRLLELVEEPKAAAFCYGYKSNNGTNDQKEKDIFIYDIGGGTLDVSYVEVKGSSFKVLGTAGDSFLGGQDFTNCIFDYVSPFLDKICIKTWRNEARFVSYVKDECEKAKQYLADSDDCDIFLDIPNKLQKTSEITLELNLTRDKFEEISHELYERCMNPVKEVLKRVQRNPKQINGLVLIGGSSFLPKIQNQLKEITGKDAYHGVSPIEAVAFGACATSVKYCEESLLKSDNLCKDDINGKFLAQFTVKETAPATIEIQKIKDKTKYFYTMIEEGAPLPYTKETLIYSADVEYNKNSKQINIPVFAKKGDKRTLLGNITYEVNPKKNYSTNMPLVKIKLRHIISNLYYSTNDPTTDVWSSESPVKENTTEQITINEKQDFNKASYHQEIQNTSSNQGLNFRIEPPVATEKHCQLQPLVVQEKKLKAQPPALPEIHPQREIQIHQEQNILDQIYQEKTKSTLPQIVQKTCIQGEAQVAQEKRKLKPQSTSTEANIQKKEMNTLPKQELLTQTPNIQEENYQPQNALVANQVVGNQRNITQNYVIENQNHNFYQSFQSYQPTYIMTSYFPVYVVNPTFYVVQPSSQNYCDTPNFRYYQDNSQC